MRRRVRRRRRRSRASRESMTGDVRRARSRTFVWLPDSDTIYFTAEDEAQHADLRASSVEAAAVDARCVGEASTQRRRCRSARTARRWPSPAPRCTSPPRCSSATSTAARRTGRATSARPTTKLLAELDLPRPESVTVKGAGGTPMQMWILKPPGFDAEEEMAARLPRPRRAAGRLGGRLELPLESRSCGRRRATSSPCPIRAAAPASARSTSTRSAATGAASATTT